MLQDIWLEQTFTTCDIVEAARQHHVLTISLKLSTVKASKPSSDEYTPPGYHKSTKPSQQRPYHDKTIIT
jgi:hypothetical protein